jgi:hypothetical protein
MSEPTIDHATFVELVDAGTVRAAHVVGRAGGWGVVVPCGKTARTLAAQRGGIRLFARLDTVVTYLRSIGVNHFDVDAGQYNGGSARRSRPDRADALKHAHKAAAYDKWFRAQVQASLNDPRPGIPNEEVAERWSKKRAQLLAKGSKR